MVAEALAKRTKIVFSWDGYVTKGVQIIGDFNAWQKEDCFANGPTTYSIAKFLAPAVTYLRPLRPPLHHRQPGPCRWCSQVYRYRFIVDDIDQLDPKAPVHRDEDGENSLLEVVNPPPGGVDLRRTTPSEAVTELDLRNHYLRDDVSAFALNVACCCSVSANIANWLHVLRCV